MLLSCAGVFAGTDDVRVHPQSLLLPGASCLYLSSQLPHPLCVSEYLSLWSQFQLSSSFCLSFSNLPLYVVTLVLSWSVSFLLSVPFRLSLLFLTRWNTLRLPAQLESVWALARKRDHAQNH